MTPQEHYAEAEALLVAYTSGGRDPARLAEAAVHAQLADSPAPEPGHQYGASSTVPLMREIVAQRAARQGTAASGVSGQITHMREVIRDYIDHRDSPEHLDALIGLLGGPEDGAQR